MKKWTTAIDEADAFPITCDECALATCAVCGHEPCPFCCDDCDHQDCLKAEAPGSSTLVKTHECIFEACAAHRPEPTAEPSELAGAGNTRAIAPPLGGVDDHEKIQGGE